MITKKFCTLQVKHWQAVKKTYYLTITLIINLLPLEWKIKFINKTDTIYLEVYFV